jgi:hypothetical protein
MGRSLRWKRTGLRWVDNGEELLDAACWSSSVVRPISGEFKGIFASARIAYRTLVLLRTLICRTQALLGSDWMLTGMVVSALRER